ncbi:MAG: hypothetical protein J6V62_03015, partial [Paludibacteraceae bacterium]|nr:hypothetical protein [Paludibacteraceae bacterium]
RAETKRSLSLSSFLSSESRSNAVTELVEVPSIDYAESQKKYQSARIIVKSQNRLIVIKKRIND